MHESEEIEEPLEKEEEQEQELVPNPEAYAVSKPALDQEELDVTAKIEREEKLIEPMELEMTEAVPVRRGRFIQEALENKVKGFRLDKETAVETGEKIEDVAKDHGASILHWIPGVGLLVSLWAKRRGNEELNDVMEKLKTIEEYSSKADPLLKEAFEYAIFKTQKKIEKLKLKDEATNFQVVGNVLTTSVVAAPVGLTMTLAGSVVKAGFVLKSIGNFFRKLFNRTLGIERKTHAKMLYGLALEYLQYEKQEAPFRHLGPVNQSLEYVSAFGKNPNDRKDARRQAYEFLEKLGVIKNTEQFMESGFKNVMDALK